MNSKNCFDFLRFFFAANILLSHLAGLSQNEHLKFLFMITQNSGYRDPGISL